MGSKVCTRFLLSMYLKINFKPVTTVMDEVMACFYFYCYISLLQAAVKSVKLHKDLSKLDFRPQGST